jgi:hypothetical protein
MRALKKLLFLYYRYYDRISAFAWFMDSNTPCLVGQRVFGFESIRKYHWITSASISCL